MFSVVKINRKIGFLHVIEVLNIVLALYPCGYNLIQTLYLLPKSLIFRRNGPYISGSLPSLFFTHLVPFDFMTIRMDI